MTPRPYFLFKIRMGTRKNLFVSSWTIWASDFKEFLQPSLTISKGIPRHVVTHMFCLLQALCIKSIKEHVMGRPGSSPLICSLNLQNSAK